MDPTTARERRWWNQLRCGTATASAEAAFALAALLCDRGREEEAETILRECSQSASDPIAAAAAIRLAQLIERRQGPSAAETIYEQAASRASSSTSADVLIDLAGRWVARGETRRARHAYRAIGLGAPDPRLRAVAFYRLGALKREIGLLGEAIRAWQRALGDAEGALRVHLLISLAEALLEQAVGEQDRVEVLLAEAIASDHPDLAPRAALRLAQLKRINGEFIDAYRLAHLVVDSEHPVFAAEGEVECERLVHGELNSLFELNWPNPDQLELAERAPVGEPGSRLYIPIGSADLLRDSEDSSARCHPHCLDKGFIDGRDHNEREFWLLHHPSARRGFAAVAFLWSAFPDELDKGDLSTIRKAIQRDHRRVVQAEPYGGPVCRPIGQFRSRPDPRALPGNAEDLEFLILLRAAVLLRGGAVSGASSEPPLPFSLVFDRVSERLGCLLGRDVQWHWKDDSPSLLTLAGLPGECHSSSRGPDLPHRGSVQACPHCGDGDPIVIDGELSKSLVLGAGR